MGQQQILEARQSELQGKIKSILDSAEAENRGITDEESTEIAGHTAEIRSAGAKLDTLAAADADNVALEARRAAAVVPAAPIQVPVVPGYTESRSEPYRNGGGDSFFRDLHLITKGDVEARERLIVNNRHHADMEKRAGATTVAGAAGEFAPPWWAVDQFVGYLRAGRVFADRLNKKELPEGISSINLPKITTGTAVAAQSTQNTAINRQDIVTTSVSSQINTIAGDALISLQILSQSAIGIDQVILQDLAHDLAQKIDIAAITAVAAVSGLNAITYTNATPTSVGVTQQVQQGIDQVGVGIFRTPDVIVMRPDRWGRILAGSDASNRPLALPSTSYGPQNSVGEGNGQNAQGWAGSLRSLPVYLDANIPNNLGAGTNQDEIFVLSSQDVFLFESAPRFDTFEATYANTASLYARCLEFYSILPNRYPKAISLITGTGMIPQAYGV